MIESDSEQTIIQEAAQRLADLPLAGGEGAPTVSRSQVYGALIEFAAAIIATVRQSSHLHADASDEPRVGTEHPADGSWSPPVVSRTPTPGGLS